MAFQKAFYVSYPSLSHYNPSLPCLLILSPFNPPILVSTLSLYNTTYYFFFLSGSSFPMVLYYLPNPGGYIG